MKRHPYQSLPNYRLWSRAVTAVPPADLDLASNFAFKIDRSTKVATAGSCFAQHIAKRLSESGFNYFIAETGHPLASPETRQHFQYGLFSARYGNIYTVRQLLQLFQEAFGKRDYQETYWPVGDRFLDPLRPNVEPNGFASVDELLIDRQQHLTAVRRMFRELDVFVFTLGLTEAWENGDDGTIYPLCPGVKGGEYDPQIHRLRNFDVSDTVDDLSTFLIELSSVNPKAKLILTVSPVPLVATAEDRHILVSTTYSKSVLRVAADSLQRKFPEKVAYFPSYEIITGSYSRGAYFAEDLRSVTEEGVDHVMRTFFRHAVDREALAMDDPAPVPTADSDDFTSKMNEITRLICEEELLERAQHG